MVYIIVKSYYTNKIGEQVENRYLEMMQKYPPDPSLMEQVVPIAARSTKEGIEVMGINLVKEGKFDEAYTRIGKALSMFSDIDGYTVSVEVWVTYQEAQEIGAD